MADSNWVSTLTVGVVSLLMFSFLAGATIKALADTQNQFNVLTTTTNQSLGVFDGSGTSLLNRDVDLNSSKLSLACLNVLSLKVSNQSAPAAIGNNTLHSGNFTITRGGIFTLTNSVFATGALNLTYTTNNAAGCALESGQLGTGNATSQVPLIGTIIAMAALLFVLLVTLRKFY